MKQTEKRMNSWINVAKVCSIIGVVIQHIRGYAYSNDYIFYSVWWVVALFIILGGYNAYNSYEERGYVVVKRRLLNIFIPYLIATCIYSFYYIKRVDAVEVLTRLLHFDAASPFYYCAVYMQLVLITPVLIGIVNWCERIKIRVWLIWCSILIICFFSTHFTNLFEIAIGGGNLLAGTWLFFWFLGIFIAKYGFLSMNNAKKCQVFVIHSIIIILWQWLFVNKGLNLKLSYMFHSDGIGLTWANAFESVVLFFWFKELIECGKIIFGEKLYKILRPFNYLGQHTLYIFLFHMLFFSIYKDWIEFSGKMNRWLCLFFIIFGPVVIDIIFSKVKGWLVKIMKEIKVI